MKLLAGVSIVLVSLALCSPLPAATIWVDDDAPNDPGPGDPTVSDPLEDGSADHPYDAIQEGVGAAVATDTVRVKDGTYTGTGNGDIDLLGKAITVESENGAEACIIDCEGVSRGFYVHSGETAASVVDGFTIVNGMPIGTYPSDDGGAILIRDSSPTIRDCVIKTCRAVAGGGIRCRNGSPVITGCTIANSAAEYGGAIYCQDGAPTITDCTFSSNRIGTGYLDRAGGAIYLAGGSATIANCTFRRNTIPGWENDGGGAIHAAYDAEATITNCVFTANSALRGGAISSSYAELVISSCTFAGNWASWRGETLSFFSSTVTITNSIVAADPTSSSCQLDICNSSVVTVRYSDIEGGAGAACVDATSTLDLDGTNIDAPPLLTPDGHLTAGSPCIDRCPTGPADDWDGEARPVDIPGVGNEGTDTYDMGADEFVDSDGDGLPDWWEALYYTDPGGDPDGDGLTNTVEYEHGTHPGEADTDNDGLSDWQEIHVHGTDPLVAEEITDVYWDEATTSVVIACTSEIGAGYVLERADADVYEDGWTWYSLPADTLTGTAGFDTFTDDLSTNPLTHAYRFYRVRRADESNTARQTVAVFELDLDVGFAVRQFFVSTPLEPDPDHDSVQDVFGTQLDYANVKLDKLTADTGLYTRATYTPGVGWANGFAIVPGEAYMLNVGDAVPMAHAVRLTGYVPEEALTVSVTRASFAVTRRWMACSMPRSTTLGALSLQWTITPSWEPTNEVRLMPLGETTWKVYRYDTSGHKWYDVADPGVNAADTPIECGEGILFIHNGLPAQPDTLALPTWYFYPPNVW